MARLLDSLFKPTDPPPLLGGAELHIVEYSHRVESSDWRTATVVINFDDAPVARNTFNAFRSAFVSARCSVNIFSTADGIGRLCSRLRVHQFGTADVVLYTAGDSAVTAGAVQDVIDAVRAMGPGLVIVVDENCQRWRRLQGVSGFIRGAESTSPATAAAVAATVAALSAPETLGCADHEDLAICLGTAEEPALLAEGFWLRRRHQLDFMSGVDEDVLKSASFVAIHLCAANLRFEEFSKVRAAVKEWAKSATLTFQAPFNNLVWPYLHSNVISLQMICLSPRPGTRLHSSTEDLISELVSHFPRLFKGRVPLTNSFLPWGWKQLVFELFHDIERLLDVQAPSLEVLQIKEKLGRLRVHVRYEGVLDPVGTPLGALLATASDQSEAVCQICGRLSALTDRQPWWNAACEACAASRISTD